MQPLFFVLSIRRLCKVRGEFAKHSDDFDVCTRCEGLGLIEKEGVTEYVGL
jgi:hypothetical protein